MYKMSNSKQLNKMSKKELIKLNEEYENELLTITGELTKMKLLNKQGNKVIDYLKTRLSISTSPEEIIKYQTELDRLLNL